MVYSQLRSLAAGRLRSEREGHTLSATALVHEAYMRMAGADIQFQDRAHFMAIAARQMRHILVDYAKSRRREKRGGDIRQVTLDEAVAFSLDSPGALLEIHEALDRLAAIDPRKGQVAEMAVFGGLTLEETAEALGISAPTAHRELKFAKAWLCRALSENQNPA